MPYSDKDFKESNVNYLNKDFGQFKSSLIQYAKAYFPETYKDFNETSPGMMLMEMTAYVGDVMSFYIDRQYREMLLPLSEERRNIMNMAKMFGYKVKPIVPAYADLTFQSTVQSVAENENNVNYNDAGIWDSGLQIASVSDADIVFETLDILDFTVSSSIDTRQPNVGADGLIDSYTVERTVRAVSGLTKTTVVTIDAPKKFRKITLSDTDVVDIISVKDSNGNNWYEVDFLAQDKVPIPTHYTRHNSRDSAYTNSAGDQVVTKVPVSYSLEYITTSKRFVRETNLDNTTSLVFGNGILKAGSTIGENYLNLEQAGIIIPGQTQDLNQAIDLTHGDEYSTLGETPMQTTLTITYRTGGGLKSNVPAGDLTEGATSAIAYDGNTAAGLISVTNKAPARGGRDEETDDEIKEKTKAFFTTQNRCVTKEDYEARIMTMSSKFGNIAKAYVSRTDIAEYTPGTHQSVIQNYVDTSQTLIAAVNAATDFQGVTDALAGNAITAAPTPTEITANITELGTVNISLLSYDISGNLVGNPMLPENGDYTVPTLLKENVKNYLDNFKILTDEVQVLDGYIINFGVIFEVVAHKFANKQQVKLLCINKIKKYFKLSNMQFSQPIFISQLEYELMDVEGVRAVNYVDITQDTNHYDNSLPGFSPPLYSYEINSETGDLLISTDRPTGYGWKYNFGHSTSESGGSVVNGVVLPPSPDNPAVFELKNPNINIIGVVR